MGHDSQSIGCVIQTASFSGLAQITVGRFIAGLGVGALSALVPLYNGEAAPKDLRGPLVVLYQVMVTAGSVPNSPSAQHLAYLWASTVSFGPMASIGLLTVSTDPPAGESQWDSSSSSGSSFVEGLSSCQKVLDIC